MGTGYSLRIWSPASVDLYSFGHYTLEKRDSACKFSANTRLEFFFSCGSFLEAGRWISLASAKKSICWRKWTCCNVSQPLKSLAETSLPKPSAVRKGYLNFLSFNNALKFNLLNLLEIIKLIFCETLPRLKRYHVLSFKQEKILKTGKRFVLELFASRECLRCCYTRTNEIDNQITVKTKVMYTGYWIMIITTDNIKISRTNFPLDD